MSDPTNWRYCYAVLVGHCFSCTKYTLTFGSNTLISARSPLLLQGHEKNSLAAPLPPDLTLLAIAILAQHRTLELVTKIITAQDLAMYAYKNPESKSPVYTHSFLNTSATRVGIDHFLFIAACAFWIWVAFTTERIEIEVPNTMFPDPFVRSEPAYTVWSGVAFLAIVLTGLLVAASTIRDYLVWRVSLVNNKDLLQLDHFTATIDFSALPNPEFEKPLEQMTNVDLSVWCRRLTAQVEAAESTYFDLTRRSVVRHMNDRISNKIPKSQGGFAKGRSYVVSEKRRQRPGDTAVPAPASAY